MRIAIAAFVALGPLCGYLAASNALLPKGDGEAEKEAEKKEFKKLVIYPMKPLLVNLRNTRGTRYLRAAISLELSEEEFTAELDMKMPKVIDYVGGKLSSFDIQEIDDPSERIRIKREIVSDLNEMFETGSILNLYFTEFVIQ